MLGEIRRLTKLATQYENEFAKIVMGHTMRAAEQEQRFRQKELNSLSARDKELDVLYEKAFEEKALGNLSEERFLKLSERYEEEQFELKAKIKNMKKIVAEEKKHELNANGFLKIVRKYSEVEELTLDILQEFINKIIIYHREEIMGETIQKIEIYYKMIGHIEIPHITKTEHQSLIRNFGRKKEERIA